MVSLAAALALQHPDLDDPGDAIETGRVLVGGKPMLNPRRPGRRVGADHRAPRTGAPGRRQARGRDRRVRRAVDGRIALDCGAAAGGFTTVLLDHGAARRLRGRRRATGSSGASCARTRAW